MPSPILESLRRQLREKFPQAHALPVSGRTEDPAVADITTGSAGRLLSTDFPAGRLSEVVAPGPVSGLGLWLADLLEETHREDHTPARAGPPEVVLIDGRDAFDPASFGLAACARLLWVRCCSVNEMLRAADLLVNDGNVPLVLLDASGLEQKELANCTNAAWWRLQHTAARSGQRVVVMARKPLIPCAARRWHLTANLSLADFDQPRDDLRLRVRQAEERRKQAH